MIQNLALASLLVLAGMNPTETAVREFMSAFYSGDCDEVYRFLDAHWNDKTRDETNMRLFSLKAREADAISVDVVFGDPEASPLVVSAYVNGYYRGDYFISTFVFFIEDGKITKLLPMDAATLVNDEDLI